MPSEQIIIMVKCVEQPNGVICNNLLSLQLIA